LPESSFVFIIDCLRLRLAMSPNRKLMLILAIKVKAILLQIQIFYLKLPARSLGMYLALC